MKGGNSNVCSPEMVFVMRGLPDSVGNFFNTTAFSFQTDIVTCNILPCSHTCFIASCCSAITYGVNIIIIISIQPEGRFWQEPEPSMALAHCILGSFLGVGFHCFPPPLDVPTFASRCLHASDMRDLYQRMTELWARNGRSILPVVPTST